MKQITNIDEFVGRTITKVCTDSEQVWLAFHDDTFAILGVVRGYYDSATLELIRESPELLENTQAVLKLGVATVQELKVERDRRDAIQKMETEEREKRDLARLLAKYK